MADLLITDRKNKVIYPIDLKTSSHCEWDFYKSFLTWKYQIQARLYWRIINNCLQADDYFKDFKLADYQFVVVNKETRTPLVWMFEDTSMIGNLKYGINGNIELKDPEELGQELNSYLTSNKKLPNGIEYNFPNSLKLWLNKMKYESN